MMQSEWHETSTNLFLDIMQKHFQLQNMSSDIHCRKYFRNHKCYFSNSRTTKKMSFQKASSVTLATIYIHGYFRNRISAHYTWPGTCHSEDANGNRVRGSQRAVNTKGFPLQPLNATGKGGIILSRVGKETVEYFGSVRGSVPLQCYKWFT
jgi:hypothetical protein